MILNVNNLDLSLQKIWSDLADQLDKLGYNINVDAGRRGAVVFSKETGEKVGDVTRDMIEGEEINYIMYHRLNLPKKP